MNFSWVFTGRDVFLPLLHSMFRLYIPSWFVLNPHKVVDTPAGVRLSFKTDITELKVTGWRLIACF